MLKNVYLAGGVRTPFGSFCGSLADMSAAQLGGIVTRESLKRAGVDAAEVDEVLMGNVLQAGHGQNVARQAALGAGLPVTCGATTINKVCGSSMRSIILGAQAIQCGDASLVVAGGTESMTNAPYLLRKARSGYRMGHGELVDSMIFDGLWDIYKNKHMGGCGDMCAEKYGFTREQQDEYAVSSYKRAIEHWENGFFEGAVVPVEIKTRKGVVTVSKDEDVAKFQGEEAMKSLRPAFDPAGTITAGNASKINDGAAAIVVFDDEKRERLGLKPAVRVLGHANVAVEPDWFSIAPIHAIRKLSERLNLPLSKVDLFEINEAFSVVAMVAIKELKLDREQVNVAGGAVAIGHPIGATGTRIVNTLIRALHRREKRIGIACLCIGGGEASAIALERC